MEREEIAKRDMKERERRWWRMLGMIQSQAMKLLYVSGEKGSYRINSRDDRTDPSSLT